MLVAWRYRKREKSFIQWFDPRAWVIFFLCFGVSTLAFWDIRFLLPFFVIATQNPVLRSRYSGKPEFVVNFFEFIAEEVREYLAQRGRSAR